MGGVGALHPLGETPTPTPEEAISRFYQVANFVLKYSSAQGRSGRTHSGAWRLAPSRDRLVEWGCR